MNNKKLCVAIPTYNSPDNIRKKLEQESEIFAKYSVDIIVFDSSTNSNTFEIVESCKSKSINNIKYIRIDPEVQSNEKVYRIFEWAQRSDYEYVWMIHDHTVCAEEGVCYLLDILNKEYDFLILNMQASGNWTEDIEDLNTFLLKGAWRLNSFGTSVIKTSTFLSGTDWDRMRHKYGDEKTLNYSHIGFYYERASQIPYFRACQVFFDRKYFIDFNRGEKIRWEQEVIRICLECWGEVISRLPDCYTNKTETLRSQDRWFMSKYSLLIYRKKGYYNVTTYMKYRKWIKILYPEDTIRDFWISILPFGCGKRVFCRNMIRLIQRTKTAGDDVYIFGAGRHAIECASFLHEIGEECDGFIVSDMEGNPNELLGMTVSKATDVLKGNRSLVLLAVLTSGVKEVTDMLNGITDEKTKIKLWEMA